MRELLEQFSEFIEDLLPKFSKSEVTTILIIYFEKSFFFLFKETLFEILEHSLRNWPKFVLGVVRILFGIFYEFSWSVSFLRLFQYTLKTSPGLFKLCRVSLLNVPRLTNISQSINQKLFKSSARIVRNSHYFPKRICEIILELGCNSIRELAKFSQKFANILFVSWQIPVRYSDLNLLHKSDILTQICSFFMFEGTLLEILQHWLKNSPKSSLGVARILFDISVIFFLIR